MRRALLGLWVVTCGCSGASAPPATPASAPPATAEASSGSAAATTPATGAPATGAQPTAAADAQPNQPNYFDATRPSSGSVSMGIYSCQKSAKEAGSTLPAETLLRYCSCVIDASVANSGGTDVNQMPTSPQVQQCVAFAKQSNDVNQPTPFGKPSHVTNAATMQLMGSCFERAKPAAKGADEVISYCACWVDALSVTPQGQTVPANDDRRCHAVGTHWTTTAHHLTREEFSHL